MTFRRVGFVLLIFGVFFGISIQTVDAQAACAVVPRELAIIRRGPGATFLQENRLAWQDDIQIVERTRAGTWVHVNIPRGNNTLIEGWVPTGYLIFDENVSLRDVPVNETIPDADPTTVNSISMSQLYTLPVMPEIDPQMCEVYQQGVSLGNLPYSVTKVGDSLMASSGFLNPIANGDFQLGPYAYLEDSARFFSQGVPAGSYAAQIGMSTLSALDPMWAGEGCLANETPLECEYRHHAPSVALIMFGPNDVRSMTMYVYQTQISHIIEVSLNRGVIPVLFTFSAHPEDDFWWQSVNFNNALGEITAEYDVPLVNLWAAARILPQYGLDEDRIHLMHSGFNNLIYTTGHDVYYGVSLQNLLALGVLDEIRTTCGLG